MQTRKFLAAAAASVALLTACGGGTGDALVRVTGFAFRPSPLEIEAGTTVVWDNDDRIAHTITSGIAEEKGVPGVSEARSARPDGLLDGSLPDENANFEFTFEDRGSFLYYCAIHPSMRGEVIVE